MNDPINKERASVPEPSGVVAGDLRIEALPWGKMRGLEQNGGYIAAYRLADEEEAWIMRVYDVRYDGEMEQDKQDRFIEELALDAAGRLRVTDELGEVYVVDLQRRVVLP